MKENIRGMECSLYNGRFQDLLLFIANTPFEFYVRWCSKIDDKRMLLPRPLHDFRALPQDLKKMAKESIWELVLHVYPVGSDNQIIETYEDFINSSCICCLIFYDCGLLDLYVKEPDFRERLYNLLRSLGAKDLELITDASDERTGLSL